MILQACNSLRSSILHSCPCHTSHQCLHTLMACLHNRVEHRCFLLADTSHPSSTRYCPYQSHISHQRRHRWKDLGYSRLVDTPILLACSNLHSSRCQSCPCHTIPQCWSSWMVEKEHRPWDRGYQQAGRYLPSNNHLHPSHCHTQHLKDQHMLMVQGCNKQEDKQILLACNSLHSSKLHSCPCHR